MLRRHLALVEGHVAQGRGLIVRQYDCMERLTAGKWDLTQANEVLRTLLHAQSLHEDHRDRLRRELGLA